ncbi:MAG: DNA polymerase I [Alphaproteobacteria bacterium]|nr:DNA polymerase I [Alphaproteobacteria bacterium]
MVAAKAAEQKQQAAPADDTLYLVDGSGFIFRAYHAIRVMNRSDGTPTNAVFGFCNMLIKLKADLNAERIAVVFDAGRKTFRNDIYKEYKANRPDPPEDLIPQFALVREATRAYGVPAVEAQNYEADDLIASYARAAAAKGIKVRIVSSDKDLMQLIREGVEMFDPMKAVPVGEAEVMEKFGVTPDKVIDVQSLAGDSTDNIPGVPGIGVKTAAELINQYGTLENLLKKAAEIKQPKRREALIEYAEQARLSKKLVTLDDRSPLPLPIEALQVEKDHRDRLVAFLQAQEFRSILARMGVSGETAPSHVHLMEAGGGDTPLAEAGAPDAAKLAAVKRNYELVRDRAALERWVAQARAQGFVAIDTETNSLTACTAKLVGVSLALAPGRACYVPVAHVDPSAPEDVSGGFDFASAAGTMLPGQIPLADLAAALKPLCADDAVLKIGHNLKYDMQVLGQHGIAFNAIDDTMLLSYVLAAGAHGHGMDELVQLHFGHKMVSFTDVAGSGKKQVTFDRVPLEQAADYAAEDADYTLRLWHFLKPQIAQQHMARVYERIERPLAAVVADMESAGILLDRAVLSGLSEDFAKRLAVLERAIHKLAGHEFNVGSPKQLGDVLFDEMGLPGSGKGKNGAWSTSVDVLEPLADQHEIVARVLDWRGLAKLKSTYTDSLPAQIDAKTGRVHTSFSLVGAATGRLSSTDPNLQNIPIRTDDGRAIRRAFVAADGHMLLSVDYSQIELRLAAEAANVKALIEAFHEGTDIHALTASQVFGIPLAKMTPDRRRAAKAINFGIIYGISGFGLAKQVGTTPGEANEFIKQYLNRFHELRDWLEMTKDFARKHGYVETLFGRRVHVPGINDKNGMRRAFGERQAINAPLQGSAADIIKRAMIRIPPALMAAKLGARMLLQVHDELLFEVPAGELEETTALVRKVMEEAPRPAVTLRVPIVAEAGSARNWAEAH